MTITVPAAIRPLPVGQGADQLRRAWIVGIAQAGKCVHRIALDRSVPTGTTGYAQNSFRIQSGDEPPELRLHASLQPSLRN